MPDYPNAIRDTVESALKRVAAAETLDYDAALFEEGLGIDSMGFLELILELENATGSDLRSGLTDRSIASVEAFIDYVIRIEND